VPESTQAWRRAGTMKRSFSDSLTDTYISGNEADWSRKLWRRLLIIDG